MLQPNEIAKGDKGEHYKLYYTRDRDLIGSMIPQLARLCAKYAFDLVLIDGNEYTGWGEFVHVRDECRPTWIALHDTGTLKTRKIEAFMQTAENTDYELHLRTADTQHGANCALVGCRPESAFEKPGQAKWSLYKRRAQTARGVLRSPSISRLDPSPLFNATRYGGERRSHLPSETKKQKIGREHQRGGRGAKGRRSPSATL